MIPCYFAVVGPTYIDCGRVYLSGALNRGWDNFRLRVKSSGSGVVVRPIDGVVLVGPLPHGTPWSAPMVWSDSWSPGRVSPEEDHRGGRRATRPTRGSWLTGSGRRSRSVASLNSSAWRDARSLLGEQATAGPLAEVYEQLRR